MVALQLTFSSILWSPKPLGWLIEKDELVTSIVPAWSITAIVKVAWFTTDCQQLLLITFQLVTL